MKLGAMLKAANKGEKPPVQRLTDMETREVSLVPKGANRQDFLIVKAADGQPPPSDALACAVVRDLVALMSKLESATFDQADKAALASARTSLDALLRKAGVGDPPGGGGAPVPAASAPPAVNEMGPMLDVLARLVTAVEAIGAALAKQAVQPTQKADESDQSALVETLRKTVNGLARRIEKFEREPAASVQDRVTDGRAERFRWGDDLSSEVAAGR